MSPEEYKALYEKHGVTPNRRCYVIVESEHDDGECHACALGIRLIEQLGSPEAACAALWSDSTSLYSETIVALLRGNNDDPDLKAYLEGIDAGFTYSRRNGEDQEWLHGTGSYPPAYEKGYAEGRAAGQALGV